MKNQTAAPSWPRRNTEEHLGVPQWLKKASHAKCHLFNIFNACGYDATRLEETNNGLHCFSYEARNYPAGVEPEIRQIKVCWDGKQFYHTPR